MFLQGVSVLFTETLFGNAEVGVKVIVHSPYDFPTVTSDGMALGPGRHYFLGVTPGTGTVQLFLKKSLVDTCPFLKCGNELCLCLASCVCVLRSALC